MDTVLPAIEPKIEGRQLSATGALDMKGGLAMLVGALDVLAARGEQPADLLLVLVPDEESEGAISGHATNRWSGNARAVLVLEPGRARANGETLVAGRRGLTEWKLEVTGRAAHSGLAYWDGRSAVAAVADWCARAQALSQRARADGERRASRRRRRGLRSRSRRERRPRRNVAPAQRHLRPRHRRGRVPVSHGSGRRCRSPRSRG